MQEQHLASRHYPRSRIHYTLLASVCALFFFILFFFFFRSFPYYYCCYLTFFFCATRFLFFSAFGWYASIRDAETADAHATSTVTAGVNAYGVAIFLLLAILIFVCRFYFFFHQPLFPRSRRANGVDECLIEGRNDDMAEHFLLFHYTTRDFFLS